MKKKTIVIAVGLCLVGICVCFAYDYFYKTRTPIMKYKASQSFDETIKVVASESYSPFSFYDEEGLPTGLDVERINVLSELMEVNIDFQLMDSEEAYLLFNEGEVDIFLNYELRDSNHHKSIPVGYNQYVAFGKRPVMGLDDLYNKKLAIIKNCACYDLFIKPMGLTDHYTVYETIEEALFDLKSEKIDYLLGKYSVINRVIGDLKINTITTQSQVLASSSFTYLVNEKNDDLLFNLNQALETIQNNGINDELISRWRGHYISTLNIIDYFSYYKVQIFVLVTILIIVYIMKLIYDKNLMVKGLKNQQGELENYLQYEQLIKDMTHSLYESVLEFNLTTGKPTNQATLNQLSLLDLERQYTFNELIDHVADYFVDIHYQTEFKKQYQLERLLDLFHNGIDKFIFEYKGMRGDGEGLWYKDHVRLFKMNKDQSLRMIIYRENIEDSKQLELSLIEKASRDPMTLLFNKKETESRIDLLLNQDQYGMFLILDIDKFKMINDTYGHPIGDECIVSLAHILREIFPIHDVVGRIGGDEFIVYCPLIKSKKEILCKISDLKYRLTKVQIKDISNLYIRVSIGCILAHKGDDYQMLYQRGDVELYHAKNKERNHVSLNIV